MSALDKAGLSECRTNMLAAIDTVLRERPQSAQAEALALTKTVVKLRDGLIQSLRAGDGSVKRELDHANALLSLVFSIQYPMQGQQWEKLSKAREALARLIDEIAD